MLYVANNIIDVPCAANAVPVENVVRAGHRAALARFGSISPGALPRFFKAWPPWFCCLAWWCTP